MNSSEYEDIARVSGRRDGGRSLGPLLPILITFSRSPPPP